MMNTGKPKSLMVPLTSMELHLELPPEVEVLAPPDLPPLADVKAAVEAALAAPTGTPALTDLAGARRRSRPGATAVVVISDNTRPVPYKGEAGILWPIVERLLTTGFRPQDVTVLVAAGTHRKLGQEEIGTLVDERVAASGVALRCHDAFDRAGLVPVGRTRAGLEVTMDRGYVEADLRILTGLVESHLMAGASGGRKSICPGLVGIESIRDFHGPAVLSDPRATDLVIEGNPCHELSVEVAQMAPPDFILNLTAREDGSVMGVFAGEMAQAHRSAVEDLRRFATVPIRRLYDVVLTHGGKVGVNHYQAAKAATAAVGAVKPGGHIILVADTGDPDPIGSMHYRALMTLLKDIGHEAFARLICSPDWSFVPDQWQVQMWGRVFARIPPTHLHYFSPQTPLFEYDRLPGRSPARLEAWQEKTTPAEQMAAFAREALVFAVEMASRPVPGRPSARGRASGAFLTAGPYGIPVHDPNGRDA